MRLRAIDTRAAVGNGRAIGRHGHRAHRAARRGDRREAAVFQVNGEDRLVELIRVRFGGRGDDQPVAGRREFDLAEAVWRGSDLPDRARGDIEFPDSRQPVLFLRHPRIILVLLARQLRLGLRLGHQKGDVAAVGRPAEGLDSILAVGDLLGLATLHGQPIDLVGAVAVGQESQ